MQKKTHIQEHLDLLAYFRHTTDQLVDEGKFSELVWLAEGTWQILNERLEHIGCDDNPKRRLH